MVEVNLKVHLEGELSIVHDYEAKTTVTYHILQPDGEK